MTDFNHLCVTHFSTSTLLSVALYPSSLSLECLVPWSSTRQYCHLKNSVGPCPSHAGILEIIIMLIPLLAWAFLPTAKVPCSFSPTIAKTHYTQYHQWKHYISHSHLNCQIPPGSPQWNWFCHVLYAVSFPAFAAMVTASYYYHTYAGSVIRTFPATPVDNIYRIFIFLAVLSQSLHANLLFLIFDTDLEMWPYSWNSAKFLRSPIHHLSRKSPKHHHLPRLTL